MIGSLAGRLVDRTPTSQSAGWEFERVSARRRRRRRRLAWLSGCSFGVVVVRLRSLYIRYMYVESRIGIGRMSSRRRCFTALDCGR